MEYVLPGLVTLFFLLFVLRRLLKRALLGWIEGDSSSADADLAAIIIREQQEMQAENHEVNRERSRKEEVADPGSDGGLK